MSDYNDYNKTYDIKLYKEEKEELIFLLQKELEIVNEELKDLKKRERVLSAILCYIHLND